MAKTTSGKPAVVEVKPETIGTAGDTTARQIGSLSASVEAILLTSEKPLRAGKIAEALAVGGDAPGRQIDAAIEELNRAYDASGRAFRIEKVGGGYRMMTRPEHAEAVAQFQAARATQKLSRAAIETLSIVAYRQPVTRAQLEAIRGVACGEVLRTLLERRLVAIVGRAEELGRPMLYGTSKQFLELFGLSTLKDLPAVGDPAAAKMPKTKKSDDEDADAQHAAPATGELDDPNASDD